LFLGKLGSPDAYAADPVEAVAHYCGRFLELMCWRDAVSYQRVALAAAARAPANAKAVYDTLYAETCGILATYLRTRKLTRRPERHAELLVSAATGGAVLRHLYGVDEPCPDMPDEGNIGKHIHLKPIREAIKTLAESWTGRISEARLVSSRPGLQSWPRRLKN
jgi:hypothetical protein